MSDPLDDLPPAPSQIGQVRIGSVMNGIYEVRRLIARGGMGEVYEGVSTFGERVAIKVMLPHLARDPNIREMFLKEARTITRIVSDAVVGYRLLAQEPTLGVLYIVTEFVDGLPMSELFGQARPTASELHALLRKLAAGLRAAHDLGLIHRDMSPDNVLLVNGRIDQPKIIDFGIAKDLDSGTRTIVGDNFAGKLEYVAPEQFGEYDRRIGPWTDIYSLALTVLAAARSAAPPMGSSLVDAVMKRRSVPPLDDLPQPLIPIFERMLQPDPDERFQSMDALLAALGPSLEDVAPTTPPAAPKEPDPEPAPKAGLPMPLLIGVGVGVVAVAAIIAVAMNQPKPAPPPAPPKAAAAPAQPEVATPRSEAARQAVELMLSGVPCSWLDLEASGEGDDVRLRLIGVAGDPAAAQSAVAAAARAAGAPPSAVDMSQVAPADPPVCPTLDAFRQIRAPTSERGRDLETAQRSYEIMLHPERPAAQQRSADAVVTMRFPPGSDAALVGVEPSGDMTLLIPSRRTLDQLVRQGNPAVEKLADGDYRLRLGADHTGWSGLAMIRGGGPFESRVVAPPPNARGAAWKRDFLAAAANGGWRAEMTWYRVTDNQPDVAPTPGPQPPPDAAAPAEKAKAP